MLDRRVLEMPKQGKVVIAHPDKEWPAKMLAASEDLRYFLSPDVVKDVVVLDVSVLKGAAETDPRATSLDSDYVRGCFRCGVDSCPDNGGGVRGGLFFCSKGCADDQGVWA